MRKPRSREVKLLSVSHRAYRVLLSVDKRQGYIQPGASNSRSTMSQTLHFAFKKKKKQENLAPVAKGDIFNSP